MRGEPLTLRDRLESGSSRGGHVTFVSSTGADPVSWARLHEEARAMGAALQARGLGPGDHVAILGPTSRELVTALQGRGDVTPAE